jgi:signal transduction histidine kinase
MAQKLKESEQMKQDFLSMISHDLRSPLGTIQGSLSLMSDGVYGEPTEQMKQVVDRLERNTTSMLNMINDLLDIDKFEAGMWQMEKAPASIVEIIERSIGTISTLAERKDIIIETNASDMTLQVDSERLIRVIVNLLSNAIKFSPKASIIKVSTETKSGWLELRVSDQGRGIPADALEKVFDRFEQVSIDDSKLKGGSGLGLAICKAIIEAHDGTIGVESEPGKGATFWFKIPCAVELSASSTVQSGQSVP